MKLYQAAAEPQSVFNYRSQSAEFKIGRLYAQGKRVPEDFVKVAEWFLKSADQGKGYGGLVPEGECALAILYAIGLGVQRDDKQRDFWVNRPNVMGLKTCRTLRDESQNSAKQ